MKKKKKKKKSGLLDLLRIRRERSEIDMLMGKALKSQRSGDAVVAAEIFRRVLEIAPEHPDATHFLGLAMHQSGNFELALPLLRRAIELDPENVTFQMNFTPALLQVGEFQEALVISEKVLSSASKSPVAWDNLGNVHEKLGEYDSALDCYQQALELDPNFANAHVNCGAVYQKLNQIELSIDSSRKAIAIIPNLVQAHWNLSQALLVSGQYAEGWHEFEWRLRKAEFLHLSQGKPRPEELDNPIPRVLVQPEQGFGDIIHFIRFLPAYRGSVSKIIFQCPKSLYRLLKNIPGVDLVVKKDESLSSDDYDAQIPLLSLPGILNFNPLEKSAPDHYLAPDPKLQEFWRSKLVEGKRNIGLAWAGSPTHENDRNRSIQLKKLETLLEIPGIQFHSLQKGHGSEQIEELAPEIRPLDFTCEIRDFADTAAYVSNLDLVITVDSAPAHLCGALGVRTWLLQAFSPDWRWLLEREDSPWYPAVKLFRQTELGNWDPVIEKVADQLMR